MNNLDINLLKTFLSVVQLGSFSKVADKEFLSQRAVSKQISKLEADLGVALFTRNANQIQLTPQGKFFFSSAQDIVNNYSTAVSELNQMNQQSPETLRLGYFSAFEKQLLENALLPVVANHPNLHLTVREESNEHLTESVSNGSLDAALSISYGRPALAPTSRLTEKPIFQGKMVMGVSNLDPLSQQTALSPADLADKSILYYSPESSTFLLESFLASVPFITNFEQIKRVTSLEQMALLVSLNQAFAFFPQGLIAGTNQELANLTLLPISDSKSQTYQIVVIYNTENKNPNLKRFLKTLPKD
ncbi:LysR family transcriptional regulator [Secundilactobacillus malefermentans]|uniref:LysR substrate-binding domain-containing protein n=1 Tax=Secundilactobacillus malefermentans TaxID=176292 RepID=UPI003850AC0F